MSQSVSCSFLTPAACCVVAVKENTHRAGGFFFLALLLLSREATPSRPPTRQGGGARKFLIAYQLHSTEIPFLLSDFWPANSEACRQLPGLRLDLISQNSCHYAVCPNNSTHTRSYLTQSYSLFCALRVVNLYVSFMSVLPTSHCARAGSEKGKCSPALKELTSIS